MDAGHTVLTYEQLDTWANQLARYLLAQGARPGDRIGLLLDRAVHSYVGMLAVLKINAAYVPLDVGFPSDRLSYIVGDAGVGLVLSLSHLRDRVGHLPAALLCVDEMAALIAVCDDHRLTTAEKGDPVDELCYIIYTSGSTGRPKGVAIEHASICNFVAVAVAVYGIGPRDRVYQGMTIAFDFSVEEIWVPLLAGATLVPKPSGSSLLGGELGEFIQANDITALCCVPTLLATLDEDLLDLRFLLVSGEACPQDLIARWHRPGRRFLNVYGPTEATVTATWALVHPSRPVTIGVPLPTYSAVILDPGGGQRALRPGEMGEIGIAGIGLARGTLASVLCLEQVSVDSHFFDDLGANSLLMAQFCARVRKRTDLLPVSMRNVYLHPTIRSLAPLLADVVPTAEPSAVDPPAVGRPDVERAVPAAPPSASPVLCAALQLLLFLGLVLLGALVFVPGFEWIRAATGIIDTYLRSLVFGGASLLAMCTVPIVAKWILVGRWKPHEIPVWSLAYVRFWLVKTLIRASPMVLLVGSPLYVLYLRALGAKIGRGVAIFSRTVPVCTDLLTIGDRTVIRKDSSITCYRAHAGWIQIGPVTLGKDVVVGDEATVDIQTSMGDRAQIGHASSLHAGQAVPDGQRWHGSPARRTDVDYRAVAAARCGTLRRFLYSLGQVLTGLLLAGPLAIVIVVTLPTKIPLLADLVGPGHSLATWAFYRSVLVISLVLFVAGMLLGLAVVATIPRVLSLAIKPDTVYPLYGIRYWIQRTIARLTNSQFLMRLFGDSSFIVGYLRYLGYDLSRIEQTGSNVGNSLKHDTPYLSFVGTGTMLSDGLSIINASYSSTSFRVSPVSLGSRSFFGNNVVYPSDGRTGDNCLIGTKAMVPIDGPVREGVGLLGAPCFEIPRSVHGPTTCDPLASGAELRRRLAAKNRYNLTTIGLYLAVRWIRFFGVLLLGLTAVDLYDRFSFAVIPVTVVGTLLFNVSVSVLVERAVARFRPLRPQFCSIYEPYYWWHERLWKLEAAVPFSGTPFKNVIWRLLGVRIGRRVFDDGCYIPEKTLVTIGDGATLNASSVIQCHSQEEGVFTSDRTTIGAGCTVGTNAFIHYGVTMGDGAVLEADSFLMKGEQIAPHARWGGNPAHEIRPAREIRDGQLPAHVLSTAAMLPPTRKDHYCLGP